MNENLSEIKQKALDAYKSAEPWCIPVWESFGNLANWEQFYQGLLMLWAVLEPRDIFAYRKLQQENRAAWKKYAHQHPWSHTYDGSASDWVTKHNEWIDNGPELVLPDELKPLKVLLLNAGHINHDLFFDGSDYKAYHRAIAPVAYDFEIIEDSKEFIWTGSISRDVCGHASRRIGRKNTMFDAKCLYRSMGEALLNITEFLHERTVAFGIEPLKVPNFTLEEYKEMAQEARDLLKSYEAEAEDYPDGATSDEFAKFRSRRLGELRAYGVLDYDKGKYTVNPRWEV